MPPVGKQDAAKGERITFAQHLADDCRRLASTEREAGAAALFEKLARLFDEAAALQRWHLAGAGLCASELDIPH